MMTQLSHETDQSCAFCTYMETDAKISDEVWQRLHGSATVPESRSPYWCFHCDCQNCDSLTSSTESTGCSFCNHLRLRHILNCILDKTESGEIAFRLRHMEDIRAQNDCDFCQYLAGFISRRDGGKKGTYRLTLTADYIDMDWDDRKIGFMDNSFVSKDGQHWRGLESDDDCLLLELPEKVNMKFVNEWLRWSRAEYYNAPLLETQPPGFRVIDLERLCISALPEGAEYVALSYVWGTSNPQHGIQTTMENVSRLEQEDSLRDETIPQTIKDAIHVSSQLGFRYLWVDRLCIVQDHVETKHGQLFAMGKIYQHAILTIIAAEGDANYGLAGISRSRDPKPFHSGQFQGFWFIEPLPELHKTILPNTRWGQRGWTFQESVCSSRILFFTDVGYFTEQRTTTGQKAWRPEPFAEQDQQRLVHGYYKWVERYTTRTLTYPTDVLWAFLGMFDHMPGRPATEHRFGLPLSQFDMAILWKQVHGRLPERPSSGKDIFPSWSWTSASGEVSYADNHVSASVASWAFVDQASGGYIITAVPFEDYPKKLCCARYGAEQLVAPLLVAWNFALPNWADDKRPPPEEVCRTLSNMKFESTSDLWHWARGLSLPSNPESAGRDKREPEPSKAFRPRSSGATPPSGSRDIAWYDLIKDDDVSAASIPGRVIVRTTTAFLAMERLRETPDGSSFFLLRGKNREECIGWIELPGFAVDTVSQGRRPDGISRMEFLALSLRRKALHEDLLSEMLTPVNVRPEDGQVIWGAGSSPMMLNIILIARVRQVARRLGVGVISLKGWSSIKPQLATIVLE